MRHAQSEPVDTAAQEEGEPLAEEDIIHKYKICEITPPSMEKVSCCV